MINSYSNKIKIANDGVDHINIYSKSKTVLGRLLSNFSFTPFIGNNIKFNSVEGWYYWYLTGKKYNYLCKLYGHKAKIEGKKYKREKEITENILFKVYLAKLKYNNNIYLLLKENNLPFVHYYTYGDKIVLPKNDICVNVWTKVKEEIDFGKIKF